MINPNPIIWKDLVQAARRLNVLWLRIFLVLFVGGQLVFQSLLALEMAGRDIAAARDWLFRIGIWFWLGAFCWLAFQSGSLLRHEWQKRTLAGLQVTPLFPDGVVRGTAVAGLLVAVCHGLGLLPVMAAWHYTVRAPMIVLLPLAAVICGGMILCGAISVSSEVLDPRGLGRLMRLIGILLPFGAIWAAGKYVWPTNPVLAAPIPFRAVQFLLKGNVAAGWPALGFSLLSLGLSVGAAAVLLARAPAALARAAAGAAEAASRPKARRWRRGRRPNRPPMRPEENPFLWQDRGPTGRVLRAGVSLLFLVVSATVAVVTRVIGEYYFFYREPWFYDVLFFSGLGMMILLAVVYGRNVFAREKVAGTAEALILTGRHPWDFYRAKVCTVYREFRFSFVLVGLVGLVRMRLEPVGWFTVAAFLAALILMPGAAAVLMMPFSASSRTGEQAFLSCLISILSAASAVGMVVAVGGGEFPPPLVPGTLVAAALTLAVLLVRKTGRWPGARLCTVLALLILAGVLLFVTAATAAFSAADIAEDYGEVTKAVVLLVGVGLVLGVMGLWLAVGLQTFEAGMLAESARPARGKPR